jgi:hypothetical protein
VKDAAKPAAAVGRGRGKRKIEEEPTKDTTDGAKEDEAAAAKATTEEPAAKKKATAGGAGKKVEVAFRYNFFVKGHIVKFVTKQKALFQK